MSPRKLTEDDKHNMLELYRNSAATTSTLAAEFGVSSSTVSRFLKNSLSQEEYEDLIQQKRLARTTKGESKKLETTAKKTATPAKPKPQIISTKQLTKHSEDSDATTATEATPSDLPKVSRRRRRKTATTQDILEEAFNEVIEQPTPELAIEVTIPDQTGEEELEEDDEDVDVIALSAILGEEIDDDDDEDEEEDDEDEEEDDNDLDYPHTNAQSNDLEILPLATASLPRICYLVVDRAAELIVKPLQEFADLGTIPESEVQQKTLPVFDNHRVAKRFSHRREKVIKVPDGKMLQKTSQYLYDKGITRLLIRGQIYEISN